MDIAVVGTPEFTLVSNLQVLILFSTEDEEAMVSVFKSH